MMKTTFWGSKVPKNEELRRVVVWQKAVRTKIRGAANESGVSYEGLLYFQKIENGVFATLFCLQDTHSASDAWSTHAQDSPSLVE